MNLILAMQSLADLQKRFTQMSKDLIELSERCIEAREEYKHVYSSIASTFLNNNPDRDRMDALVEKINPEHIENCITAQILSKIDHERAARIAEERAAQREAAE